MAIQGAHIGFQQKIAADSACSRPSMDRRARALKALGHPDRIRLFWLLAQISRSTGVADAMYILDLNREQVSRHFQVLEKAGLVCPRHHGKSVSYSLNRDSGSFVTSLLTAIRDIPAGEFRAEIQRYRECLEKPLPRPGP